MGYTQAMTFQIWEDDKKVAVAMEENADVPSLTYRNLDQKFLASAWLMDNAFHGTKEHWLVKSKDGSDLPNWIPSASTLLFAFHTIGMAQRNAAGATTATAMEALSAAALPASQPASAQASRAFLQGNTTKAVVPSAAQRAAEAVTRTGR